MIIHSVFSLVSFTSASMFSLLGKLLTVPLSMYLSTIWLAVDYKKLAALATSAIEKSSSRYLSTMRFFTCLLIIVFLLLRFEGPEDWAEIDLWVTCEDHLSYTHDHISSQSIRVSIKDHIAFMTYPQSGLDGLWYS